MKPWAAPGCGARRIRRRSPAGRRWRSTGAAPDCKNEARRALPAAEASTYVCGERLEAFLSQPLNVAESHTHQPGIWSALPETLEDVRRILDGGADHLPVESLRWGARLPKA
jgi:F-type H+-transporting ATPase subunit beta